MAPLLQAFPYASCVPFGRARAGVLLRAADVTAPLGALVGRIDALFGLDSFAVMRYDDHRRGVGRRIAVIDGRLAGVRLSGSASDLVAETWLKSWLQQGEAVSAIGPLLLSPSARAPAGFVLRGAIVCNCCNVAAADINTALGRLAGSASARLSGLQAQLRCGTECGSCLPELKRMVALAAEPAQEAA